MNEEEELLKDRITGLSALPLYLRSIKGELLTDIEEKDLFEQLEPCQGAMYKTYKTQIHECDICKPIKEKLILSNLRYVVKIATQYRNKGLSLDDLIQEGNMGLIRALIKFKTDKGFRFTTYSTHWIRQYIRRALDDKSRDIRLPVHRIEYIQRVLNDFKINRLIKEDIYSFICRKEYPNKIGTIGDIQIYLNRMIHLDAKIDNSGDKTGEFHYYIASNIESAESRVLRQMVGDKLGEVIKKLCDKVDIDIVSRRFGMLKHYGENQTLEAIGQVHDICRERVRQREGVSLKKMKKIIENDEEYSDLVLNRLGVYKKSTI